MVEFITTGLKSIPKLVKLQNFVKFANFVCFLFGAGNFYLSLDSGISFALSNTNSKMYKICLYKLYRDTFPEFYKPNFALQL